jgi:hypothetical protein
MKSIIASPNGLPIRIVPNSQRLGEATHKFEIYLSQKEVDDRLQGTASPLGFILFDFYRHEYVYRPENGHFISDKNLANIVELIGHYFSMETLLCRPQLKFYLN